ncbi:hypothetical protein GC163_11390 [bacterium]|nr:hypothetical protein [bacterium]
MLNSALDGQAAGTLNSVSAVHPGGMSAPLTEVYSSVAAPRVMETEEVRRRMLHMLPGLFPFILWGIPHTDPWGPIITDVVIGITVLIVGTALYRFSSFARPGEADGRSSVLGYAFPIIVGLWVFHGWEEIGMMTLTILAFGDGSATLCGMTFGGRRLPWNPKKTITGLMCFVLIGGPLASAAFWGECRPGTTWLIALACGFGSTLVAALAESVPSRINDNLRVGATAMIMGALLHYALIS